MTLSRSITPALAFLLATPVAWHIALAGQPGAGGTTMVPAHFFALISPTAPEFLALQASTEKPKSQDPLPEGKGKDVTQRTCSGCHSVEVFASQRHTSDEWSSIIDNMVSKGLDASDQDLATINNYLGTYLAPPKSASAPASTPAQPPQP